MAEQTFTAGQVLTAAQMTTLQTNIGLSFVKTQTFSGSGTAQFTNCFNSTYTNYCLVMSCTTAPTSGQIIQGNMLSSTTPAVGAGTYSYYEARNAWAGTPDVSGSAADTKWFAMRSHSFFFGTMQIQFPFVAQFTSFQSSGIDLTQSYESRGVHTVSNSYDGIQFKCSGGNLDGFTVTSYGYR